MSYSAHALGTRYHFEDLRTLLAKASPSRSGDELAGIAAGSATERAAAQMALADVPLREFLREPLIPYEEDEVTRLIFDTHDEQAFAPVAHLTVGDFRNWLLSTDADPQALTALSPGITPEMAAAVSKLMRVQDLIAVASRIRVVTRFRTTVGLPGRLSTRLQPNHPTDDPRGILASVIDGLMLGSGDAVIGINPAADNVSSVELLLHLLDRMRVDVPHARSELRARARDNADGGDATRSPRGSGLSIHCRNGSGKLIVWCKSVVTRRSLAGRPGTS